MSLMSKQDFIKAAGLQKFGFIKSPIASTIMGLTKLNDVNRLYDSIKHHDGVAFFDAFLKKLEIQYVAFEEDLAKIPKTGPFILVANHPLGAVDGILMCKILSGPVLYRYHSITGRPASVR